MNTSSLLISLATIPTFILADSEWWPKCSTSDCDETTTRTWPKWTPPAPVSTPCDETTTLVLPTSTPCEETTTGPHPPWIYSLSIPYTPPAPASTSSAPMTLSVSLGVPTMVAPAPITTSAPSLSLGVITMMPVLSTTARVQLNSTLSTIKSSLTLSLCPGCASSATASPTPKLVTNAGSVLKVKGEGLGNAVLALAGLAVGMWML